MSTPYPKMVKAQLVDPVGQARCAHRPARVAAGAARGRCAASRPPSPRAGPAHHGLRREAAKHLCEELGVRSVTTAQIDSYLAEVAGIDEVPW